MYCVKGECVCLSSYIVMGEKDTVVSLEEHFAVGRVSLEKCFAANRGAFLR